MAQTQGSPARMRGADRAATMMDEADRQINLRRTARINPAELAHDLNISRSLLYSYFPDTMAVVAAVMERHSQFLLSDGMEEAAAQSSFLASMTETSLIYLRHVIHRGAAIEICFNDRGIARRLAGGMRDMIFRLYRKLAWQAARELSLSARDALGVILILQAIPEEAAKLVRRGELTQSTAEMLCRRLLRASIEELTPAPEA